MNEIIELIKLAAENNKKWEDIRKKETTSDPVKLCGKLSYGFHIYTGIEKVAEAFNAELKSKLINYEDGTSKTEIYFNYDGLQIFQLVTTEEK